MLIVPRSGPDIKLQRNDSADDKRRRALVDREQRHRHPAARKADVSEKCQQDDDVESHAPIVCNCCQFAMSILWSFRPSYVR
jgi:hypothetical protein